MWRNYLTIAVRSLIKDKQFAALNIIGLAVGMAASLMILLFVRNEQTYDRWLPGAERVYAMQSELRSPDRKTDRYTSGPGVALPFFMKDFREFEFGTRIATEGRAVRVGDTLKNEPISFVDKDFFKVLNFPIEQGLGHETLQRPDGLIVSKQFAQQRFGRTNVLGQTLVMTVAGKPRTYRIGGILKDFPPNTQFKFDAIAPIVLEDFKETPWVFEAWGGFNLDMFFKLKSGASADTIKPRLRAWAMRNDLESKDSPNGSPWYPHLVNIQESHLQYPVYMGGAVPNGDPRLIAVMQIIAALILGIAGINYVNLATARVSKRAKEVGLRKALGANRSQLMSQFLVEALVIAACAALIALALVEILLPAFNTLLDQRLILPYFGFWGAIPLLMMITLIMGIAGGAYPAFVLSQLRPQAVLASRAYTGGSGSDRLRRILVVIQFAVSIGLMICMGVIYAQVLHLRSLEPGYQPKGLFVINGVGATEVQPKARDMIAAIKKTPGFNAATGSIYSPGINGSNSTDLIPPGKSPNDAIVMRVEYVDEDYIQTYGARIIAGRNLSTKYANDNRRDLTGADIAKRGGLNILINRAALRPLGFTSPQDALGKSFSQNSRSGVIFFSNIVGVVEDFQIRSGREEILPAYYVVDKDIYSITVRFDGITPAQARERLESVWKRYAPNTPFDAELATTNIAKYYEDDVRRGNAFALFSGIAIALCCLGLYGLAAFTAERRTKEIGIRKVLGARTQDIVKLLVWQFSKPVLWANIIAWPVAWWLMRDWLNGFSTRISLSPLWFIGATIVALIIAWVTVAGQSLRVARAKPITALRYE
jgi:putative ABC transport system permease protein